MEDGESKGPWTRRGNWDVMAASALLSRRDQNAVSDEVRVVEGIPKVEWEDGGEKVSEGLAE